MSVEDIPERATKLGFDCIVRVVLSTKLSGERPREDFAVERLQEALRRGNARVAETWISRVPDINLSSGHFNNALQAAVFGGHRHCVELVLHAGAHPTSPLGRYGTALRAATFMGHKTVVKTLLAHGSRDFVSVDGLCALAAATFKGYASLVQTLIDVHHPPEVSKQLYAAALEAAASQGHDQICTMLLDW